MGISARLIVLVIGQDMSAQKQMLLMMRINAQETHSRLSKVVKRTLKNMEAAEVPTIAMTTTMMTRPTGGRSRGVSSPVKLTV
jgi:hypothetical protein